MAHKKIDLDNWTPSDPSNPLKSLAVEVNNNFDAIKAMVDAISGVAGKGFASGYVNAGQFVTLDNLKFSVTTSGNRGLSCATVTGSVTLSIYAAYSVTSAAGGNSTQWPGATYTTTPQGPWFGYHFPNAGDGSVYIANDYTNGRVYRITLLIGVGYNNNFISIERLA
jgi:hypothetical protein